MPFRLIDARDILLRQSGFGAQGEDRPDRAENLSGDRRRFFIRLLYPCQAFNGNRGGKTVDDEDEDDGGARDQGQSPGIAKGDAVRGNGEGNGHEEGVQLV